MRNAFLFFAALIITSGAHASFIYKLTEGPSDKEFRSNAQSLLREADSLLPPSIKKLFKQPLEVRFEKIKGHNNKALGQLSWGGSIRIDLKAIAEIRKGRSQATPTSRTHGSFYREILATVLHETIHAYDKLNIHSPEEWAMIRRCKQESEVTPASSRLDRKCRAYANMYLSYSQDPYFQIVSGFIDGDESWLKHRSPDIYELTSPSEYFAVNMEYFLLDPNFACRRPSLYNLFRSKFAHTPFAELACQPSMNFVIPDFKGKNSPLRQLDPSRIYQVHYLLAGEGDAMMSGWGHSMFRLVVCAPKRKEVGPECLKDLEEHIVLSYRAFVNNLQINTLKGLTGAYPSRLFFVRMNQVVDEYSKTELRDLRSIPLKLNRPEITQFVVRALETHWSYDGRYYFTSNNCAVESLNLIKSSVFRPDFINIELKSPLGLERELLTRKLADNSMFKDRNKAISDGYLFDSYKSRYEISYDVLRKSLKLPHADFQDFLTLSAAQRAQNYARISTLDAHNRRKASAAILLLENGAHRFLTSKIKNELADQALRQENSSKKSKVGSKQRQIVQELSQISDMFSQPASFLKGAPGYGLPSDEDREQIRRLSTEKQEMGFRAYAEVEKDVENMIHSERLQEIKAIRKNVEFALTFMRSL